MIIDQTGAEEPVDLPRDYDDYVGRIKEHHEGRIWKNPVIMPPNFPEAQRVYDETMPWPKRAENGDILFKDHPEFEPNTTPEEVLRGGSFGGHYFRPIHSGVTN